MAGAEGFEVSFPSDHFAVFFVEIKGKPAQIQRFPNFSGMPFFPYSPTSGLAFRKKLVSLVSPP